MNEGFVGDSNVLDSSMNGGMGLNGSFLNEESDEQAQMRNTVERELNEDQMQFEQEQLNKYKSRNVELEGIRKKEQKENEKNIEKDLKELKKSVKIAEDDRKKVLAEKKKGVKKTVEGQIQEDFQAAKSQQESDLALRKQEVEDLERIQLDKEASAFERDRKDGLEAKSRKLENARRDRSEAQRKFDQQFKDQRNKVNNQFQSFREVKLQEYAEKLSGIEKEQQKYLKEEQSGLKDTNMQLERQEADTTEQKIAVLKQTLKKTKEKIEAEAADRQQQLMNSIQSAHKLQNSALHAQNEESKIEKALESENELKKRKALEEVQNRIQAERQELTMKASLQSIEIGKEVERKYFSQREQLKREAAEKQKKLKETFKSNSELDESAFELICTKQAYQSNIEEHRQTLNAEQRIMQKEQEAIDNLKEELQIVLELYKQQQTLSQSRVLAAKQPQKQLPQDQLNGDGSPSDSQEVLLRNTSSLNLNILQLSEIEKRIEKLSRQNDDKEKELKQLEITKQHKKEEVVNRRKANLEFQKELILTKQKMRIQQLENASDSQKFQQFQDLVKHLQNTLAEQQEQQAEQQKVLQESLKKQAELHEEQQQLKEQQISQLLQFQQQQQSMKQTQFIESENNNNNNRSTTNKPKENRKHRKQSGEDMEGYNQQKEEEMGENQQYKQLSQQQRQSTTLSAVNNNNSSSGNIRRVWQNSLIIERNILTENKQLINSRKQHISEMEEQIQKDQLSLSMQLNSAPSELKKSVLESMEVNMQQQIKRIEAEIASLQEMEIVYALKDQQLSTMEKLYDQATTQDIIGNNASSNANNSQSFNQQTFQQLFNLYATLSPASVGASSVIEAQQKQLLTNNLSTAWKTIIANNMPTASLLFNPNNSNQNGGAPSAAGVGITTATANQAKSMQLNNNYVNASSLGGLNNNNASQVGNNLLFQNASGRYDVKGALETLRNKYAIPGHASSVIDAPQMQVNHLRKKIAEGSNSQFVAYNNWVTNIKSQLNQQILEGPFSSVSQYNTIL